MGVSEWISSNLQGNLSDDEYSKLPGVNAPDPSAYQIKGLGDYQSGMQGLAGEAGANAGAFGGNLQGATAGTMGQQNALQQYMQSVATGQAPSAADQMLQNASANSARQLQSGMVSAGGMNPALAMRQLFQNQASTNAQLAGQGAAQKLKEQESFGAMAQRGNAQMYQEQAHQVEATYNAQMQGLKARQDIANGIFNSNRDQTSFNSDYQANREAFQMYQRSQAQQHAQDQARSRGALARALVTGTLTAGGAVAGSFMGGIGGGVGAMAGASLAGSLTGGGGGGGGGLDPAMLAALMQRRGGGGGNDPTDPNDLGNPNGLGDTNGVAPGMYRDPALTGTGQGSY